MKPNPTLQAFFVFLAITVFAALFGSLLWETWDAAAPFDPKAIHLYVLPFLGGAFGLVLALALGVDPAKLGRVGWGAVFTVQRLLLFGAVVYALAAVAGGFVWWKKDAVTPELVTTIVVTVAGYAAALIAALGRKPSGTASVNER